MQMEIVFNVRARDNTGTVVKWGCLGVDTVCVLVGLLAFAQNISFTMKTI